MACRADAFRLAPAQIEKPFCREKIFTASTICGHQIWLERHVKEEISPFTPLVFIPQEDDNADLEKRTG